MSGGNSLYEHACPKCNHVNTLRGKALTVALTCKKCGIYFCLHTNVQDQFPEKFGPAIPVGARGTFDGKMYEVMGVAVKRERKYKYSWREYFLFHPLHGIAFLSEYDGNWNFLQPYAKHPWSYGQSIDVTIEQGEFKLYAKYKADVLNATGEFFTDLIYNTEESMHYEHIHPPYILNYETNAKQTSAYLGQYISRDAVGAAFNIPREKLPKKGGMGYTEPLLFSFEESTMLLITIFSMVVATLVLIFFNGTSSEQKVFQSYFYEKDLKEQKMFTTPSFQLKDGLKNLVVRVYAPVSNDWFFAEYSLINETSDEEYVFTKEIEYYFGSDDGGSWSEGEKESEAFLSSIPEGKYHINIYPEFSSYNHEFSIGIYRDVPFYSNYVIVLLMLCLFPIGFYTYRHYKEVQRWSDSDYSPYKTNDE